MLFAKRQLSSLYPKGLKPLVGSEGSQGDTRTRYKNKVDDSVLDPVRLLFSLGSSTRSIGTVSRVTTSDSSNGTANHHDNHTSYNGINGRAMQMSKDPEHSFPWKLHTLLEAAERDGFDHIVSWVQDGAAFKVHDSDAFVNTIMPSFFDQSKCKSIRSACVAFQRR